MQEMDGWLLSDKRAFKCGVDKNETRNGTESVFLKSVVPRPRDFGSMNKIIDAALLVGKTLRMSAWLKTDLPEGASAQLWLRVDGDWKQRPAECFDNMFKRRVKGRNDWHHYEVSVEVPTPSQKIAYGVLLNGTGQLWLNDIMLEQLDPSASAWSMVPIGSAEKECRKSLK